MSQDNNKAVDWNAYSDSLDGDTDLMEMLSQLFLEHIDDQIERVQAALASSDANAIEKAAHGIKGSLAQVCAADARDSAQELETRGRENNVDDVEELGEELQRLVGEARECFRAKYL